MKQKAKYRMIALLLALLMLGTGCTHGPAAPTEVPASETVRETASAAPAQTQASETAPETEPAPEPTEPEPTEPETTADPEPTAPETTAAPEPTEPEPWLDVNDVGKVVVHVPVPADDRPAWDYTFDPYACSGIFRMAYGEGLDEEVRGFMDAVLACEDSFPCSGLENWLHINAIKDYLQPFCIYVDIWAYEDGDGYDDALLEDGRFPLEYTVPKDEFCAIVADFQARIEDLIAQADLREGDSDLEKAMKLYTASSLRIEYDYEAAGETTESVLCAYRVLMRDYGICQEIAPAYAYLLLQAGVDAGICGSLAKDGSYAHMWTLIGLDGVWYHADVTWQVSDPYSLRYFLTTDDDRDRDGLDVEYLNIGEINELWHRDMPINDDRYSYLWDVRWYAVDHAAGCIEYYDDPWLDYYDLDTYTLERKTAPLQ